MKLLIVDDSSMVRKLIESAYRGTVFTEIKTASDGVLAVTKYVEFNPDVVTLDITMPNMDGLAALSQILEHNPMAKVLVISALADHHTAIESLKRGATQFICKPFTSEDLQRALEEVMNPALTRRKRRRRRDQTGQSQASTVQRSAQQVNTPPSGSFSKEPYPNGYTPVPAIPRQSPSRKP